MKSIFKTLFNTRSTDRRRKAIRPQFEGLEERAMMTASPFSPFHQVMSVPVDAKEMATASSANGMSAAVWSHQSGADLDVSAMLYGPDGVPLDASFSVASQAHNEEQPDVAMDANGNFVVAWTDNNAGSDDVKAKFYDANGNALNELFVASSSRHENSPQVAMDQNGNVTVTYRELQSGKWVFHARTFTSMGGQIGPFAEAHDFAIGADPNASALARADDGRFAVAFATYDGEIRLQRHSPSGVASDVQVIDTPLAGEGDSQRPDIAVDASGNGVVVWLEHAAGASTASVKARRFSSSGALGATLIIDTGVLPSAAPSVAMAPDGGDYLVAYESQPGAAPQVEYVRMHKSGDSDASLETGVLANDAERPDVSVSGLGEYSVSHVGGSVDLAALHRNDFDFEIQFNFIDTFGDEDGDGDDDSHQWTDAEKDLVRQAASRWESVISSDLPNQTRNGIVVDDVLIDLYWEDQSGFDEDGNFDNGPLAVATHFADSRREGSLLPSHGFMVYNKFFEGDPTWLGNPDAFVDTTTHEMGHVIGMGTLWQPKGLVTGVTFDANGNLTGDPRFTGANATAAYNDALVAAGLETRDSIPVEDVGGAGSVGSHWRESVLDHELMTSEAEFPGTDRPLSAITVGALEDMGYVVFYGAAESYSLPANTTNTITSTPASNGKSNIHADMNHHEDGNDGKTDTIEAIRNGDALELWINGELIFTHAADDVHELSVTGAADDEYVAVDAALGIHVRFDGHDGYDRYTVNGTSGIDSVSLWASRADINGNDHRFDNVEYLNIDTQFGNSTTTIQQFPMASMFVARGDYLHDTYRINTVDEPTGYVYLLGQGGANTLEAADRANAWDILSSSYGRLNSKIIFMGMDNLQGGSSSDEFAFGDYGQVSGGVDGAGGSDRLDYSDRASGASIALTSPTTLQATAISGVVSNVEEVVGSNSASDRITGPNESMYWYITGDDAGYLRNYYGYSPFNFYNVESINGGSQSDTFRFYGSAGLSGDLIGRGGVDSLYYTSYNLGNGQGVYVDLMENAASSVKGGVYLVENVIGSRYDDYIRGDDNDNNLYGYYGNDILIGMGGDDYLRGSYSGRNILVGGKGADTLYGGRNEDLLIAGFTVYESSDAKASYYAFAEMRELWSQTSRTFDERVSILRDGFSSNGMEIKLDARSVHDDGEKDRLTGSDSRDWFFANEYEPADFNVKEDVLN